MCSEIYSPPFQEFGFLMGRGSFAMRPGGSSGEQEITAKGSYEKPNLGLVMTER